MYFQFVFPSRVVLAEAPLSAYVYFPTTRRLESDRRGGRDLREGGGREGGREGGNPREGGAGRRLITRLGWGHDIAATKYISKYTTSISVERI